MNSSVSGVIQDGVKELVSWKLTTPDSSYEDLEEEDDQNHGGTVHNTEIVNDPSKLDETKANTAEEKEEAAQDEEYASKTISEDDAEVDEYESESISKASVSEEKLDDHSNETEGTTKNTRQTDVEAITDQPSSFRPFFIDESIGSDDVETDDDDESYSETDANDEPNEVAGADIQDKVLQMEEQDLEQIEKELNDGIMLSSKTSEEMNESQEPKGIERTGKPNETQESEKTDENQENNTDRGNENMLLIQDESVIVAKMLVDNLIENIFLQLEKPGFAQEPVGIMTRRQLKRKINEQEEEEQTQRKKQHLDVDSCLRVKAEFSEVNDQNGAEGWICDECGLECKNKQHLRNHILAHNYSKFDQFVPQSKPFACPDCGKESRDKTTLIRHIAWTHQRFEEITGITEHQLKKRKLARPVAEGSRENNLHEQSEVKIEILNRSDTYVKVEPEDPEEAQYDEIVDDMVDEDVLQECLQDILQQDVKKEASAEDDPLEENFQIFADNLPNQTIKTESIRKSRKRTKKSKKGKSSKKRLIEQKPSAAASDPTSFQSLGSLDRKQELARRSRPLTSLNEVTKEAVPEIIGDLMKDQVPVVPPGKQEFYTVLRQRHARGQETGGGKVTRKAMKKMTSAKVASPNEGTRTQTTHEITKMSGDSAKSLANTPGNNVFTPNITITSVVDSDNRRIETRSMQDKLPSSISFKSNMTNSIHQGSRGNLLIRTPIGHTGSNMPFRHWPSNMKKKKKKRDPNAPKRPMSSYFLFMQENRESVLKDQPGLKIGDIAKEMGKRWAEVGPEEKEKFEKLAETARTKHVEDKAAYYEAKAKLRPRPPIAPAGMIQNTARNIASPFRNIQTPAKLNVGNIQINGSPVTSNTAAARQISKQTRVFHTNTQANLTPARPSSIQTRLNNKGARLDVTPARPDVTPAKSDATPARPGVTPARPGVTPARSDATPARPTVQTIMNSVGSSSLTVTPSIPNGTNVSLTRSPIPSPNMAPARDVAASAKPLNTPTRPNTTFPRPATTYAMHAPTSTSSITTFARPALTSVSSTTTSARPNVQPARLNTPSSKPTTTPARQFTTSARPMTTTARPNVVSARPGATHARPVTTPVRTSVFSNSRPVGSTKNNVQPQVNTLDIARNFVKPAAKHGLQVSKPANVGTPLDILNSYNKSSSNVEMRTVGPAVKTTIIGQPRAVVDRSARRG